MYRIRCARLQFCSSSRNNFDEVGQYRLTVVEKSRFWSSIFVEEYLSSYKNSVRIKVKGRVLLVELKGWQLYIPYFEDQREKIFRHRFTLFWPCAQVFLIVLLKIKYQKYIIDMWLM